jgi:ABC-type multidrug transport system permease subunit
MNMLSLLLLNISPKERVTNFGIWWLIGFVLILALGMLAYVLIKKNPRKDAND